MSSLFDLLKNIKVFTEDTGIELEERVDPTDVYRKSVQDQLDALKKQINALSNKITIMTKRKRKSTDQQCLEEGKQFLKRQKFE